MFATGWALKRLYKFVLKRLLGRVLKNELDLEQLDVQLGSGTVELRSLVLNHDYLSEQLAGLPLAVVAGEVSCVRATIPWKALGSQSCTVELEGLDLTFAPRLPEDTSTETGQKANGDQPGDAKQPDDGNGDFGAYLGADDGIHVIAILVEKILLKMRLKVTGLTVHLEGYPAAVKSPPGSPRGLSDAGSDASSTAPLMPDLLLQVAVVEYIDDTPSVQASPTADVQPAGHNLSPHIVHNGLRNPTPKTAKRVSFEGLVVAMGDQPAEGPDLAAAWTWGAAGASGGPSADLWYRMLSGGESSGLGGTVNIKLDYHKGPTERPKVSLDLELQPLHVHMSPYHVDVLQNMVSVITTGKVDESVMPRPSPRRSASSRRSFEEGLTSSKGVRFLYRLLEHMSSGIEQGELTETEANQRIAEAVNSALKVDSDGMLARILVTLGWNGYDFHGGMTPATLLAKLKEMFPKTGAEPCPSPSGSTRLAGYTKGWDCHSLITNIFLSEGATSVAEAVPWVLESDVGSEGTDGDLEEGETDGWASVMSLPPEGGDGLCAAAISADLAASVGEFFDCYDGSASLVSSKSGHGAMIGSVMNGMTNAEGQLAEAGDQLWAWASNAWSSMQASGIAPTPPKNPEEDPLHPPPAAAPLEFKADLRLSSLVLTIACPTAGQQSKGAGRDPCTPTKLSSFEPSDENIRLECTGLAVYAEGTETASTALNMQLLSLDIMHTLDPSRGSTALQPSPLAATAPQDLERVMEVLPPWPTAGAGSIPSLPTPAHSSSRPYCPCLHLSRSSDPANGSPSIPALRLVANLNSGASAAGAAPTDPPAASPPGPVENTVVLKSNAVLAYADMAVVPRMIDLLQDFVNKCSPPASADASSAPAPSTAPPKPTPPSPASKCLTSVEVSCCYMRLIGHFPAGVDSASLGTEPADADMSSCISLELASPVPQLPASPQAGEVAAPTCQAASSEDRQDLQVHLSGTRVHLIGSGAIDKYAPEDRRPPPKWNMHGGHGRGTINPFFSCVGFPALESHCLVDCPPPGGGWASGWALGGAGNSGAPLTLKCQHWPTKDGSGAVPAEPDDRDYVGQPLRRKNLFDSDAGDPRPVERLARDAWYEVMARQSGGRSGPDGAAAGGGDRSPVLGSAAVDANLERVRRCITGREGQTSAEGEAGPGACGATVDVSLPPLCLDLGHHLHGVVIEQLAAAAALFAADPHSPPAAPPSGEAPAQPTMVYATVRCPSVDIVMCPPPRPPPPPTQSPNPPPPLPGALHVMHLHIDGLDVVHAGYVRLSGPSPPDDEPDQYSRVLFHQFTVAGGEEEACEAAWESPCPGAEGKEPWESAMGSYADSSCMGSRKSSWGTSYLSAASSHSSEAVGGGAGGAALGAGAARSSGRLQRLMYCTQGVRDAEHGGGTVGTAAEAGPAGVCIEMAKCQAVPLKGYCPRAEHGSAEPQRRWTEQELARRRPTLLGVEVAAMIFSSVQGDLACSWSGDISRAFGTAPPDYSAPPEETPGWHTYVNLKDCMLFHVPNKLEDATPPDPAPDEAPSSATATDDGRVAGCLSVKHLQMIQMTGLAGQVAGAEARRSAGTSDGDEPPFVPGGTSTQLRLANLALHLVELQAAAEEEALWEAAAAQPLADAASEGLAGSLGSAGAAAGAFPVLDVPTSFAGMWEAGFQQVAAEALLSLHCKAPSEAELAAAAWQGLAPSWHVDACSRHLALDSGPDTFSALRRFAAGVAGPGEPPPPAPVDGTRWETEPGELGGSAGQPAAAAPARSGGPSPVKANIASALAAAAVPGHEDSGGGKYEGSNILECLDEAAFGAPRVEGPGGAGGPHRHPGRGGGAGAGPGEAARRSGEQVRFIEDYCPQDPAGRPPSQRRPAPEAAPQRGAGPEEKGAPACQPSGAGWYGSSPIDIKDDHIHVAAPPSDQHAGNEGAAMFAGAEAQDRSLPPATARIAFRCRRLTCCLHEANHWSPHPPAGEHFHSASSSPVVPPGQAGHSPLRSHSRGRSPAGASAGPWSDYSPSRSPSRPPLPGALPPEPLSPGRAVCPSRPPNLFAAARCAAAVGARGGRAGRARPGTGVEVRLEEVRAQLLGFELGHHYASRWTVAAKELEALDTAPDAAYRHVVRYYQRATHPRESHSSMAEVVLDAVRPNPSDLAVEEYRVRVALLPLSIYLDQQMVDFLAFFFSVPAAAASPDPPGGDPEGLDDDAASLAGSAAVSECGSEGGQRAGSTSGGGGGGAAVVGLEGAGGAAEEGLPYIQRCEVRPVDVHVDYHPRRVDLKELCCGNLVELINVVPWNGVDLTLSPVKVSGVHGWGAVGSAVAGQWLEHIAQNQAHKFFQGVTPVRSLCHVGAGTAQLVLQPLEQYRREGRVLRGVRKGALAFAQSVSLEALGFGAGVAGGAHLVLEAAQETLGIKQGAAAPGRRRAGPAGAGEEERRASGKRGAANTIGVGAGLVPKDQPSNAKEGLQQASRTLSHGVGTAADALVRDPMKAYKNGEGAGTAIFSALKAVPRAAVTPASAAAAALQQTLVGMRNGLSKTN